MPKINDFAPIAPPQNQQIDAHVGPQGRAQQGNQARNLGLNLGEVPDALQNARPSTARIIGRVLAGIFTLGISEGIRAIVNHVRSGSAENRPLRPVDVPHAQANVDQANSALANNLGKKDMPVAHMAAMKEALDDLRARFGESIVPPFNGPEDLAAFNAKLSLFSLTAGIKECTAEVSPAKLKLLAFETLQRSVTCNAVSQCYQEYCDAHNYQNMIIYGQLFQDFPTGSDRAQQLTACTNSGEVHALFDSLEAMPARLEQRNQINSIQRDARQSLLSQLSQKTGIPENLLPDVIDLKKFTGKCDYLGTTFMQAPLPQSQMKAAYTKLVDTFLTDKTNVLDTLNTIDTSRELKIMLQNELLKSTLLKGDMLRPTMNDGSSVDTTSFAQFLRTAKPDTTTIAQFLSSLGTQIVENREKHITYAQWDDLGGDMQCEVRVLSAQALLHSKPELLAALRSLPNAMQDELNEIFSQQFNAAVDMPDENSSDMRRTTLHTIAQVQCIIGAISITTIPNTELADTIGTKNVDPAYAGAIGTAMSELREKNGPGSLPPGYISQWTHIEEMTQPLEDFKNQIRDLKETPSPQEVAKLFTTIMQHARDSGNLPYIYD